MRTGLVRLRLTRGVAANPHLRPEPVPRVPKDGEVGRTPFAPLLGRLQCQGDLGYEERPSDLREIGIDLDVLVLLVEGRASVIPLALIEGAHDDALRDLGVVRRAGGTRLSGFDEGFEALSSLGRIAELDGLHDVHIWFVRLVVGGRGLGRRLRANRLLVFLRAPEGGGGFLQAVAGRAVELVGRDKIGLADLPADFDQIGATLENAARLDAAGVGVGFSQAGDASHNARKIRQLAGNAVANGLPWEDGLAGLTRVPAETFGVGDRVGTIAPGKLADLVLWSGDPLDVAHTAQQVWLGGRAMPMRSRQTELRDRYLQQAGPLPRAYSK